MSLSCNKVFQTPEPELLANMQVSNSYQLLQFLVECQKRSGNYVFIEGVAGLKVYLLSSREAVKAVLVSEQGNFTKPQAYAREMDALMGKGLLTSEGADWLWQRQISQPAFQMRNMNGVLHVISSCTQNLMNSWLAIDAAEWIDFFKEMIQLTNAIAVELVFGAQTCEAGSTIKGDLIETLFEMKMLNLTGAPGEQAASDARRLLDQFHEKIVMLIEARRNQPEYGDDLLAFYLRLCQSQKIPDFSEELLLDEIKTLVIGGHHNVAAVLSWLLYLLERNESAKKQLLQELDEFSISRTDPNGLPYALELSSLNKVKYLYAAIEETMRLYPPVWAMTRETRQAVSVDGYDLPAGAMVMLCQWIIQRDPANWVEPQRFKPERFLDEATVNNLAFAYFPFGKGPRKCIAQDLSFASMLVIAAHLLVNFSFELPGGWTADIDAGFVLAPKGGLPVRLKKRN